MATIYLTKEGYDNLIKELDKLKKRKPEISYEIGRAREMGDLKENAEYHAAKEEMSHVMRRIAEVENKIATAKIIDEQAMDPNVVYIGAKVTLKDLDENDEFSYTIVDIEEANPALGKISVQSPMAQGMLGHKVGEKLTIALPASTMNIQIMKIER